MRVVIQRDDDAIDAFDLADGTIVRLASRPEPGALQHQPTPDPSGRFVAWAGARPGDDGTEAFVAVHDLATQTTVRHAVLFPGFYLHWRPDSGAIGVLANGPLGLELTVVDVVAGTARLVARGAPLFFDWSPDGWLCLHLGPPGEDRLVLVSPDGDDWECPSRPGGFTAPAWHPEGDRVLVTLGDGTLAWWWRDDATTTPLAPAPAPARFTLSGDGRRATLTAGTTGLGVLDLFTGRHTAVVPEPPIATWWSPDGASLLLLEAGMVGGLPWVRHRVWASGEMRWGGIWHRPSAVAARHYLPFPEQYQRSHRVWIADGSAHVFAGSDTIGREGLWCEPHAGPVRHLGAGTQVIALADPLAGL